MPLSHEHRALPGHATARLLYSPVVPVPALNLAPVQKGEFIYFFTA